MKEFFRELFQDKTIISAFFANAFILITSIVYVLISYGKLPPFIPIFNQLPWGEQRLGSTITVFVPILIALLIFSINIFASALIYKKNPLISRMLEAISLLITILTFLFVAKTIALII
jgi:hypothetical protein